MSRAGVDSAVSPEESSYERERAFHDAWAQAIDPQQVLVRETWEGSTSPENRWILSQLGDVRGKRVLELGSGAGEGAVYLALKGAHVVASDLSPGMLEVVRNVAARFGTTVSTVVQSAEDLSACDDESVDIVYGANVMHHVDIARCLNEVLRVLKPGGRAAFWDPVAYNPVINRYRRMATSVRTEGEHPLRCRDLELFRLRFSHVEHRFFWLSGLLIFLKFYLVDRVHPGEERYWKRIIVREAALRRLVGPLLAFDRVVLALCPPLGWWCWNIAVVVTK